MYDGADQLVAVIDPLARRTTTAYDPVGRVASVTTPDGATATTGYDLAGGVVATTDPVGRRTVYGYDGFGRQVSVTDPLGHTTTTAYDLVGNPVAVTDPLGHTTSYAYDALDRLVAVTDPLGNTTTTVYDAAGEVVATIDPRGDTTTTVYDARGRVSAAVDALGNRTTDMYDAADRLVAVTDPLGHTATTVYDAADRVIAAVDPLGNRTTTVYDTGGRVTATVDPLNHPTSYGYDALDRVVSVVDALGNTTTTVYDAADRVVATVDPLGNTTTTVYDGADRVVAVTDPLGHQTGYGYDAAGQLVTVTDPLNHTTTYGYDGAGRPAVVIDPLLEKATTVYDAADRAVNTIDPLGNTATAVYDAAGNVVATVDPLGNTTTAVYDPAGNVVATVDPLGHRTTAGYDAAGQRVSVTDPLNHTTTTAYDAAGRAVASVDPLGNRTTTAYDAAGNVRTLTDPDRNTTTWAYDAAGQLVTETDPLGASRTYSYDAAGRLASRTDRLGRRTDYGYDPAGRQTTETWYAAGGSPTQTQTYTYDPAGELTAAAAPAGTYTLAYDDAGRVRQVAEPFGLVLTFAYDGAGDRTRVQDSAGGVATTTFDAAGRMTGRQLGGTGVTPVQDVRAYDAADRPASESRQAWVSMTWKAEATTAYDRDAAGRVTHIKTTGGAGAVVANDTYTYDAADRLATRVEGGSTTSYAYDAADQLTGAGLASYAYDPNGNRGMAGYTTGAGNRTTSDGTWTYTYDAEGDVIKKSKGASSDTWQYGYDENDQLVSAAFSATDGGTVTQRVTYVYDAFGNRIERDAWDGITSTVTRYGLDGWDTAKPAAIGNENFDAWADLDGSNNLTYRRLFGPDFGAPVARETAAGVVSWYVTDQVGSVRLVLDNSGSVSQSTSFDAFGVITSGTLTDRYGFGMMQYDPVTGDYSAGNGRRDDFASADKWLEPDPVGLTPDPNPYRVDRNRPTTATDPSGMWLVVPKNEWAYWVSKLGLSKYKDYDADRMIVTMGNGLEYWNKMVNGLKEKGLSDEERLRVMNALTGGKVVKVNEFGDQHFDLSPTPDWWKVPYPTVNPKEKHTDIELVPNGKGGYTLRAPTPPKASKPITPAQPPSESYEDATIRELAAIPKQWAGVAASGAKVALSYYTLVSNGAGLADLVIDVSQKNISDTDLMQLALMLARGRNIQKVVVKHKGATLRELAVGGTRTGVETYWMRWTNPHADQSGVLGQVDNTCGMAVVDIALQKLGIKPSGQTRKLLSDLFRKHSEVVDGKLMGVTDYGVVAMLRAAGLANPSSRFRMMTLRELETALKSSNGAIAQIFKGKSSHFIIIEKVIQPSEAKALGLPVTQGTLVQIVDSNEGARLYVTAEELMLLANPFDKADKGKFLLLP